MPEIGRFAVAGQVDVRSDDRQIDVVIGALWPLDLDVETAAMEPQSGAVGVAGDPRQTRRAVEQRMESEAGVFGLFDVPAVTQASTQNGINV